MGSIKLLKRAETSVTLASSVAIEKGLRFDVRDDERTIGAGVVKKIIR